MEMRNSFGTVETGRVWFGILIDDRNGGQVEDWSMPLNVNTRLVPGSNPPRSFTEIVSIGVSTVTWQLDLDSRADYQALRAKLGTTDVLTVRYGLQSHAGTYHERPGGPVEALEHTTLLALEQARFTVGGPVEVSATFQRTIDPATGLAVTS